MNHAQGLLTTDYQDILDQNNGVIASMFASDADADRLVACWNACNGTPTEKVIEMSAEQSLPELVNYLRGRLDRAEASLETARAQREEYAAEATKFRAEQETLRTLVGEAYVVIGSLAMDLGRDSDPAVVKVLENLATEAIVHADALPFPSFGARSGESEQIEAAEPETLTLQEVWQAAGGNPGIKPTREDVLHALRMMDQALDDDTDHTHKCVRCRHAYTPAEGASEDCPVCGCDGSPT